MSIKPEASEPKETATIAELRSVLDACVRAVLAAPERLEPIPTQPYLQWRQESPHSWRGEYINKPDIAKLLACLPFESLAEPLHAVLPRAFPHLPGLIGTQAMGWRRVDAAYLLRSTVADLVDSSGQLPRPDSEKVGDVVDIAIRSLSDANLTVTVLMPLVNLTAPDGIGEVPLVGGHIRRMTPEEVSDTYGGFLFSQRQNPLESIAEWAAEMVNTTPITTRDGRDQSVSPPDDFHDSVERFRETLILALRVVKDEPVGVAQTIYSSWGSICIGGRAITYEHEYIPIGRYELAADDVPLLQRVADKLRTGIPRALQIACRRLGSAAIRRDPSDRLLDAAIGLEAILLAPTATDKYKGEVRYRFALNYATHFKVGTRRELAFERARDIYDLRSLIAHGGKPKDLNRVGEDRLSLNDGAIQARRMLRSLVLHYLNRDNPSEIEHAAYWNKRLLDPSDEKGLE